MEARRKAGEEVRAYDSISDIEIDDDISVIENPKGTKVSQESDNCSLSPADKKILDELDLSDGELIDAMDERNWETGQEVREDLYVIDLETESDTEDIYVNEIELATENEELYPIREINKRKLSNNNKRIFSEKEENYTSLDECLDDSIYTIRRTLAGRHKKLRQHMQIPQSCLGRLNTG